MAWPFPDNEHRPDSCEVAFGRTAGCEGAWNAEARKLLGMMVAVGGVGVLCVVSRDLLIVRDGRSSDLIDSS